MPRIAPDQIEVGAGPQNTLPKYGAGPEWELEASRLKDDGTDLKLSDVPVILFNRVVVPLTNAQIKSIPTDAPGTVTLLAAPGAGKWAQVVEATFLLDTTAGAYAAGLDANWAITYGANGLLASTGLVVEAILETAAYSFVRLGPPIFAGALVPLEGLQAGSSGLVSEVENQALLLADNAAGAAYTLGNAANTLIVDLVYRVVDV